jgi:hypothetical protein
MAGTRSKSKAQAKPAPKAKAPPKATGAPAATAGAAATGAAGAAAAADDPADTSTATQQPEANQDKQLAIPNTSTPATPVSTSTPMDGVSFTAFVPPPFNHGLIPDGARQVVTDMTQIQAIISYASEEDTPMFLSTLELLASRMDIRSMLAPIVQAITYPRGKQIVQAFVQEPAASAFWTPHTINQLRKRLTPTTDHYTAFLNLDSTVQREGESVIDFHIRFMAAWTAARTRMTQPDDWAELFFRRNLRKDISDRVVYDGMQHSVDYLMGLAMTAEATAARKGNTNEAATVQQVTFHQPAILKRLQHSFTTYRGRGRGRWQNFRDQQRSPSPQRNRSPSPQRQAKDDKRDDRKDDRRDNHKDKQDDRKPASEPEREYFKGKRGGRGGYNNYRGGYQGKGRGHASRQ